MHGVSSTSHMVATGLVVSGVDATSIRSTLFDTINSRATSAARLGIGLAVLDDDLDRIALAADPDSAAHGVEEIRDHEIVGLGKGGERPGLRADVAELERTRGMHGGSEHAGGRDRYAARGRALDHARRVGALVSYWRNMISSLFSPLEATYRLLVRMIQRIREADKVLRWNIRRKR